MKIKLQRKKDLEGISQEYTIKEEITKPVSDKMLSIIKSLFPKSVEEEKLKQLTKKHYRIEDCAIVPAPRVNSEKWNGNIFHPRERQI